MDGGCQSRGSLLLGRRGLVHPAVVHHGCLLLHATRHRHTCGTTVTRATAWGGCGTQLYRRIRGGTGSGAAPSSGSPGSGSPLARRSRAAFISAVMRRAAGESGRLAGELADISSGWKDNADGSCDDSWRTLEPVDSRKSPVVGGGVSVFARKPGGPSRLGDTGRLLAGVLSSPPVRTPLSTLRAAALGRETKLRRWQTAKPRAGLEDGRTVAEGASRPQGEVQPARRPRVSGRLRGRRRLDLGQDDGGARLGACGPAQRRLHAVRGPLHSADR